MTRFDRLLAELAEDPDVQIKKSWIHTGPEAPSAADRRMANKAGAEEFLALLGDTRPRHGALGSRSRRPRPSRR